MREVKFRAWDSWNEAMHYPEGEKFVLQFDGTIGHFNGKKYDTVEWELMQFTGLKDKNGKEIYEGDILKYKYYKDYGQSGELVDMPNILVQWVDSKSRFDPLSYWKDYDDQLKTCEVIGNIHQNPDLL